MCSTRSHPPLGVGEHASGFQRRSLWAGAGCAAPALIPLLMWGSMPPDSKGKAFGRGRVCSTHSHPPLDVGNHASGFQRCSLWAGAGCATPRSHPPPLGEGAGGGGSAPPHLTPASASAPHPQSACGSPHSQTPQCSRADGQSAYPSPERHRSSESAQVQKPYPYPEWYRHPAADT